MVITAVSRAGHIPGGACLLHGVPVTAPEVAALAPLTTRRIVAFDGGLVLVGWLGTAGTGLPGHRRARRRLTRGSRVNDRDLAGTTRCRNDRL
jgi:hypothetical protein